MTNEQVMQAVTRLTDTYNQLNGKLELLQQSGQLPTPLYSNHKIIWDGFKSYEMTDGPMVNVINVGAGQVKKHNKWNAQYMIACENKTTITNCTNQTPTNYVVIKTKLPKKDGTFFLKQSNADNWGHGIISAWLADPVTKAPVTYLGSMCADKHADVGKCVALGPDNAPAWCSRYFQWLAFNYSGSDVHFDSDEYAYIALSSSVTTWYIGGWAYAERNTDFVWTPARIFDLDFYGSTTKSIHNGLSGQITYSRFESGKLYDDVRIPYKKPGKDLLIGFLCLNDYSIPTPYFSFWLQAHRCDVIPTGNFARIMPYIDGYRWLFIHVPASDVTKSTKNISGLHCFSVGINPGENERHFYFAGAFSESLG